MVHEYVKTLRKKFIALSTRELGSYFRTLKRAFGYYKPSLIGLDG